MVNWSRWLSGVLAVGSLFVLSGCSDVSISGQLVASSRVESFNNLVVNTLSYFSKSELVANKYKGDLLSFLVSDSKNPTVLKVLHDVTPLSDVEKTAFAVYSTDYDNYFTALGSTGLREVVIISSQGYKMYATALWNENGLYDLNRVVYAQ